MGYVQTNTQLAGDMQTITHLLESARLEKLVEEVVALHHDGCELLVTKGKLRRPDHNVKPFGEVGDLR